MYSYSARVIQVVGILFQEAMWTWKFDPSYQSKYDFMDFVHDIGTPKVVLGAPRVTYIQHYALY